jgi:hypothetical protein
LPNKQGYRIYQSYNDAYSLKAWLSENITGLFNATDGDIMIFNKVKFQVNGLIQQLTNGQFNINSNLSNVVQIPQVFLPFIKYVRDYNQTKAVDIFKRALNKYGKSKILSWETFSNYIDILANMTSYLKENVNTQTLFSEKIYNNWIDLFGSPNPVHFVNLPNNAVTNFLFNPKRNYDFQVKTIILDKSQSCEENFFILKNYL